MKKAIYIMQEDPREDCHNIDLGKNIKMNNCDGHIEYTYEDACTFAIKRMWYGNPDHRKNISDMIKTSGYINTYNHYATPWIYYVTFVMKYIDTDRF